MGSGSHKVGSCIDAYCRRCEALKASTVAAVIDGNVMTVVCTNCNERQRYKDAKPKGSRQRVRVVDVPSVGARRRVRKETPARPIPISSPDRALDRQHGQRKKPLTDKIEDPQANRWRRATDGVHSRFARPHRVTDTYVVDELILHKIHGMGVVEKVGSDGTLAVLFRARIVLLGSQMANDRNDRNDR